MSQVKVFVSNRASHDYSDAERFGSLVFLTEGAINRFDVENMKTLIYPQLAEATPHDYWMVSSLTILNMVGEAYLIRKHGGVRILLLKNGRYIERVL